MLGEGWSYFIFEEGELLGRGFLSDTSEKRAGAQAYRKVDCQPQGSKHWAHA
jgi:hypothetical protein